MKRLGFVFFIVLLFSVTPPAAADPHIVDLSHSYENGMPVYPGSPPFALENLATIDQGYYINKFSTSEHAGTHIDAPSHFSADGAHVDAIPLEDLRGPLVVLNLAERAKTEPDMEVSKQDILDWEAQYGDIPSGAFVVANTDWWKKWNDPAAYLNKDEDGKLRFPGFSVEAVQYLLEERDIKGVGTDTLSTDKGSSHKFDQHHLFLGEGKINIENLTNLDQVPPAGATLVIAPLKIAKGSGAPARIFAILSPK